MDFRHVCRFFSAEGKNGAQLEIGKRRQRQQTKTAAKTQSPHRQTPHSRKGVKAIRFVGV